MLKRLLLHQEVVKSVLVKTFQNLTSVQKSSLIKFNLTVHDWKILQSIYDVLKPFEFATRVLSGKNYPTLSLAYTTINILRNFLKQNEQDGEFINLLKKSLSTQFEHYFDIGMSEVEKELMRVSFRLLNSFFFGQLFSLNAQRFVKYYSSCKLQLAIV